MWARRGRREKKKTAEREGARLRRRREGLVWRGRKPARALIRPGCRHSHGSVSAYKRGVLSSLAGKGRAPGRDGRTARLRVCHAAPATAAPSPTPGLPARAGAGRAGARGVARPCEGLATTIERTRTVAPPRCTPAPPSMPTAHWLTATRPPPRSVLPPASASVSAVSASLSSRPPSRPPFAFLSARPRRGLAAAPAERC